jgi:predicted metal-dependent HD superfamily phosphohydrolase
MATMSDDAELQTAWCEHVDATPGRLAHLEEVIGRHREPHRRYHGVRHVTWVVRHVKELARQEPVGDLDAVVAAAFFHDAIYRPRAHDNETASADLAARVLADLDWAPARAARVGELIRATAGHDAAGDPDRAVLLDADLAVLGSDPAAYQAYVTGVRAEYGHVTDADWRAGRAALLRRFIARPAIYATKTARDRWERRARANLVAELATLET